jgi:hypothetical protein
VSLYVDIHGHSRKCNMFMYGCSSKHPGLRLKERVFPFLLHNESLMFSYDDCNFKVQRCKESAARVVSWRELAIPNSYTLEMSLGGGNVCVCVYTHIRLVYLYVYVYVWRWAAVIYIGIYVHM